MSIIQKSFNQIQKSKFLKEQLQIVGISPKELEKFYSDIEPLIKFGKKVVNSYNSVISKEKDQRNIFQYIELALDCKDHFDILFDSNEEKSDEDSFEAAKLRELTSGKYCFHCNRHLLTHLSS